MLRCSILLIRFRSYSPSYLVTKLIKMAAHATTEHAYVPGEIAKPNTGWIWKTFWVLVIITAVEFAIAFTLTSPDWRTLQ